MNEFSVIFKYKGHSPSPYPSLKTTVNRGSLKKGGGKMIVNTEELAIILLILLVLKHH